MLLTYVDSDLEGQQQYLSKGSGPLNSFLPLWGGCPFQAPYTAPPLSACLCHPNAVFLFAQGPFRDFISPTRSDRFDEGGWGKGVPPPVQE